ncbi:DMT family transporter [Candidatus Saccharibacteria bacterium]|nr:DMT family transporter [Candidatus Saccharibacteria bacterium]
MSWLVPLSFFFVFGTASFLLRRYLAQRIPQDNALINLVFYVVFLLPVALVLGLSLPHTFFPGWNAVWLLLAVSAVWPLYFMATFRASKDLDAGILSMITDMSAFVTLAISYMVIDERLGLAQLGGVVLLAISGLLAVWPDIRSKQHAKLGGILIALMAMVIIGFATFIEKIALNTVQLGTYFLYGWGLQAIWMIIFSYKDIRRVPAFLRRKKYRNAIFGYGIFGILRSVSFALALLLVASPTVMNAGSNFLTVTVLIAAYVILHEKENLGYKIAGALCGLAGLTLLAQPCLFGC